MLSASLSQTAGGIMLWTSLQGEACSAGSICQVAALGDSSLMRIVLS
jgi:hypothetical protein